MIAGLFYGMQNDNFVEYSEYLFIINKDNHDYLIKFLIEVKIIFFNFINIIIKIIFELNNFKSIFLNVTPNLHLKIY